jgi:hypothetical protein
MARADYLAQAGALAAQAGRVGSWSGLGPQLWQPGTDFS